MLIIYVYKILTERKYSMQSSTKNTKLIFIITLALTLTFVIFRSAVMLMGFDFESRFFSSNALATFMYAIVLITSIVIYLISKNVEVSYSVSEWDKLFDTLCLITFTIISVVKLTQQTPFMPVERVTLTISLLFGILSVVYYALSIFSKNEFAIRLLNVAPIVYLLSETIYSFVIVSGKANSYYLFADIFSVLILGYYILNKAKTFLGASENKSKIFFAVSLVSIMLISFSLFPDLILLISGKMTFDATYILISTLKLIYVISGLKSTYEVIK